MAARLVAQTYKLDSDEQVTVRTNDVSDDSDDTFIISQGGIEVVVYRAAIPDLIEALSALSV